VHGFPECWWTWRHVIPALAQAGHRVAALDLRGFGGSDRPPSGYDLVTLAQDLAAVVRSLGHERAVVVGAGLGIAGCAMQTLVRNPLAHPYLLGVSSGASVGATAVITFGILSGFGLWSRSIGALFGALGAALAVYLVAMAQGGLTRAVPDRGQR